MTEQQKQDIRLRLPDYLAKTGRALRPGKNGPCPICGGDPESDRARIYQGNTKVHCFGGDCGGKEYDIFDIIGYDHNTPDFKEQQKIAANYFNVRLDDSAPMKRTTPEAARKQPPAPAKPEADFTEYYKQCQARAEQGVSYLMGRGISREVCEAHGVGYDPQHLCMALSDPDKGIYAKVPAVIIPVTKSYYNARNIDQDAPKAGRHIKPSAAKGAISAPMNLQYLDQDKPVFIVESAIDAMSIETAGGKAIATNGAGIINQLVKEIETRQKRPVFIIAMDEDTAGKNGASKLAGELERIGSPFLKAKISAEHKDANDRLRADPDGLRAEIEIQIEQAEVMAQRTQEQAERERQKELEEYKKNSTAGYLEDFMNKVGELATRPAIPTGYKKLDNILDGGLFEGLYIIGAISSLGKTTFMLQMADNIAASGHDVLLFSLEMSKFELAGKSISRQTFILDQANGRNAKSTRGITNGAQYRSYTNDETNLILNAVVAYKKAANNIYIIEATGDVGVNEIREAVEKHIKITGNRPVVAIDYLQIIKPRDPRASDKQNTDYAVSELKRISRDHKLPIIGISSLNRENYTTSISMAAFKESGAIEYSSDVLIGLQVSDIEEQQQGEGSKSKINKFIDAAKKQDPRGIELKILKNRNGKTGDIISYEFYPRFNYFAENGEEWRGQSEPNEAENDIDQDTREVTRRNRRPRQ